MGSQLDELDLHICINGHDISRIIDSSGNTDSSDSIERKTHFSRGMWLFRLVRDRQSATRSILALPRPVFGDDIVPDNHVISMFLHYYDRLN